MPFSFNSRKFLLRSLQFLGPQFAKISSLKLNSVGFVPSCFVDPKCFLVCILWLQNFFPWVFRGSKIFFSWVQNLSHWYFVGSIFCSWVFCGSEICARGYFVGSKIFLVSITLVQNLFSWVFCG